MATETAISFAGVMMTIITKSSTITFEKDDQFEAEMANTTGVIAEAGTHMTGGEHRRQWMHNKLNAWIDGVEE